MKKFHVVAIATMLLWCHVSQSTIYGFHGIWLNGIRNNSDHLVYKMADGTVINPRQQWTRTKQSGIKCGNTTITLQGYYNKQTGYQDFHKVKNGKSVWNSVVFDQYAYDNHINVDFPSDLQYGITDTQTLFKAIGGNVSINQGSDAQNVWHRKGCQTNVYYYFNSDYKRYQKGLTPGHAYYSSDGSSNDHSGNVPSAPAANGIEAQRSKIGTNDCGNYARVYLTLTPLSNQKTSCIYQINGRNHTSDNG
jgi:hypothetical protein